MLWMWAWLYLALHWVWWSRCGEKMKSGGGKWSWKATEIHQNFWADADAQIENIHFKNTSPSHSAHRGLVLNFLPLPDRTLSIHSEEMWWHQVSRPGHVSPNIKMYLNMIPDKFSTWNTLLFYLTDGLLENPGKKTFIETLTMIPDPLFTRSWYKNFGM